MTTVVGERDALLQATTPRYDAGGSFAVLLTADSYLFKDLGSGAATPSTITLTAKFLNLSGVVTWSVSGATLTGTSDNVRTLLFSNTSSSSVIVTATLVSNGITYSDSKTISKVADGTAGLPGGTGAAGPQTAIARLYQWSTTVPAAPLGTSTWTWPSAANSAYSASDGWSVTAPSNPGTPLIRLYVVEKYITAAGTVTTSTISYSGATLAAWSQNGSNGSTGIQSAAPTVYQWAATIPTGPSGSPTWTWATQSFGAAPSGYSLTPGTAPSPGYTLWAATVRVTDSAANATTGFNWSTAAVMAIGYAGSNGGAGAEGASYVTAYCASATASTTTAPSATTGRTSLPATNSGGLTGTYSSTVPTLTSGQFMYQTDGIYNPATDQITWSIPYWSSLKVATLSAITANLGAINAGSIDLGGGVFTVDNAGNLVCTSITIKDSSGNVILSSSSALNPLYAAAGTKNSDAVGRGAALNTDPACVDPLAWVYGAGVVSFVTVTDGVSGSTAIRSSTTPQIASVTTKPFPMTAGRTYKATTWIRGQGGAPTLEAYFRVFRLDATGGTLAYVSGYEAAAVTTPVWTQWSYTFVAPANTAQGKIELDLNWNLSGSGYYIDVQDVRIDDVTDVAAAQTAADAAATAAEDAYLYAIAVNTALDTIFADNVLSRDEKTDLLQRWNLIYAESPLITAQASALGVSSVAYTATITALQTYLNTLSPAWNDTSLNTAIVRTDANTAWNGYYTGKVTILNAIAAKIQANAVAAQGTATAAATAASNAQTDATAANTALTAIFADNVLSRDEKQDLIQRIAAINSESPLLQAQADSLSVSRVSYGSSQAALGAYLVSLSPAWNDTTQNTPIVRADANTAWNNYYTAKVALLNAIAAKSATISTWTGTSGRPDDALNLLGKSSFEDGLVGSWDGGPAVAVSGQAFTKALQWTTRDAYYNAAFPVTPGEVLYVEADIDASSAAYAVGLGVMFDNAAGAIITWTQGANAARVAGAGWARVSGPVTVPAGAIVGYGWLNNAGFSGLGTARAANIRITRFQSGATMGAPSGTYVGGTLAQTVEGNASTALANAATAQAAAAAANTALTDIFADNILSRDEKPDLLQRWQAIEAEVPGIRAQADALSVSRNTYDTTRQGLQDYLSALSPNWADTSQNTPIVRADANTAWNNYYVAKVVLLNAIAAKIQVNAAAAQTSANTANSAINDSTTGLATRLRNNAINILSGGGAVVIGSLTVDGSGNRTGGTGVGITTKGIACYAPGGAPTVIIDAVTGAIAVAADISGSTGTFGAVVIGVSLKCGAATGYNNGTNGIWMGLVGGVPKMSIVYGTASLLYDPTATHPLTLTDLFTVKTTPFAVGHISDATFSFPKGTTNQNLGFYTASSVGGTGTISYVFSLDQDLSPGAGMSSYISVSGNQVQVLGKNNFATNCDIYLNVAATDGAGVSAIPWRFNINVDWT